MRVSGGDGTLNMNVVRSVEINCMCTRLEEQVSSVGQVEIVCRFRRVRVSILFRALKPRSCVDFARCSLEFGSDLKLFTELENYRETEDR